MLRFVTRAAAAALVHAPLARLQATSAASAATPPAAAAAADATTAASTSNSSTGGNSQAAVSGGRNTPNAFRAYTPSRLLPKFEIFDVRDQPAHGTMTRVSVDGKQLLISQYPQLGPRKVDPNDMSPQFDSERRISVRLRHRDMGALVSVVEDRMPHHRMTNNAYDLTFEKTATGYTLHGLVHRVTAQQQEEWAIQFDKQFAVMLEHFLQSAIIESFGFQSYYSSAQSSSSSSMTDGARPSNNNNNNNNNNSGGGGNARRNRNRGNAAGRA